MPPSGLCPASPRSGGQVRSAGGLCRHNRDFFLHGCVQLRRQPRLVACLPCRRTPWSLNPNGAPMGLYVPTDTRHMHEPATMPKWPPTNALRKPSSHHQDVSHEINEPLDALISLGIHRRRQRKADRIHLELAGRHRTAPARNSAVAQVYCARFGKTWGSTRLGQERFRGAPKPPPLTHAKGLPWQTSETETPAFGRIATPRTSFLRECDTVSTVRRWRGPAARKKWRERPSEKSRTSEVSNESASRPDSARA